MSANFYELLKYAATGQASPGMTYYDRMRASALMGGGAVQTLTGQPPLTFKADGTPLISWSMKGNTQQTGTPTPDAPIMPEFVGVRTGNLWMNYPNRTASGVLITSEKGVIRFSGVCSTSGNLDETISLPAGRYRLAANPNRNVSSDNNYLINLYKSGVLLFGVPNNNTGFIASDTLDSDTDDILMRIRLQKKVDYTGFEMQPMLNAGTEPLPYEPYGYKIPITNAGQTTPVYLGQTPTVRRIKKRVFDGSESWTLWNYQAAILFYTAVLDGTGDQVMSSHFGTRKTGSLPIVGNFVYNGDSNKNMIFRMSDDTTITTVDGFKAWLAAQYAAGTPVTVWYVLAEPETGIVNEPLCKIGNYADELRSEDAAVTIPTAKGNNTLTVDTVLQPSEMTITYKE